MRGANDDEPHDIWTEFSARRADMSRAFAAVIASALPRADTTHPAFHGCFDWHSAVHGTYALLAISRMTGDPTHRDLALAVAGQRSRLDAEVADLRAGRLAHEVPYGLAWVLHLDLEARHSGRGEFGELAEVSAALVANHLRESARDHTSALATEYDNTAWAASALLAWTTRTGNRALRAVAEESAHQILTATTCHDRDIPAAGFFSPHHLAALLAMQCLPGDEMAPYIAAVANTAPVAPSAIDTVHRAGLNFSSAWGCYAAWLMTGCRAHREDYASLMNTNFGYPALWRDRYVFSHWVPQFGTFAIAMTDPIWFDPRTPAHESPVLRVDTEESARRSLR